MSSGETPTAAATPTPAPATAPAGAPSLGTSAVFLTTISTILGAILFLRFGYAVAHLGFVGTAGVILIGHLVTVPTALAISEIATNQRVQGGGVYYIISRSFGLNLGGAIGIALFNAQAISVAFYAIAFAQAFVPSFPYIAELTGFEIHDPRWISVPTTLLLMLLMFTRGAAIGVRLLYPVVGVLFVSLVFFFLGANRYELTPELLVQTVDRPDNFFLVFAICFPAFTGLTSGVGLSGDLADSRRSIPAGTLAAVGLGFIVYLLAALKLSVAASPEVLDSDELVMSQLAIWGPIIPIGLAAGTLSSALGSILVAPRTLQAVAADGLLPSRRANRWLSHASEKNGEPLAAVVATSVLATAFALLGDIDFVAQIISMFFMVSYGAICLISALEYFAAEPSYRPSFRSRWYISLMGAAICVWLMFKMGALYALFSLALLVVIYYQVRSFSGEDRGLATLLRSAGVQLTRRLQVTLQTTQAGDPEATWRPAAVCLSEHSFDRTDSFEFMRWLAHRYGFSTYIHLIVGYLSRATRIEAEDTLRRLIEQAEFSESNVYVDTIVSPSYSSAVAQLVQIPGISGQENNLILLEFPRENTEEGANLLAHYPLAVASGFDVAILTSSPRRFGYQRQLHVWLTPDDYANANLMILLSYIVSGHPSWSRGEIKIFAISKEEDAQGLESGLKGLLKEGRLPIAPGNIEVVTLEEGQSRRDAINLRSESADLTVLGLRPELVKQLGGANFEGYDALGAILFVTAQHGIDLDRVSEPTGSGLEEAVPEPADAAPDETVAPDSNGEEGGVGAADAPNESEPAS